MKKMNKVKDVKVYIKEGTDVRFVLPNGKESLYGNPCIGKVVGHYEYQGREYYSIVSENPGLNTFGIVEDDVHVI